MEILWMIFYLQFMLEKRKYILWGFNAKKVYLCILVKKHLDAFHSHLSKFILHKR